MYSNFCILYYAFVFFFFFLMIRRPPRSTHCISSAASDVYKRQHQYHWSFHNAQSNMQYSFSSMVQVCNSYSIDKEQSIFPAKHKVHSHSSRLIDNEYLPCTLR
eukprot:TRINITY_DN11293_c0_g1_i3.p3 TRINITY_DN11293_c0_g1~~TRINITY_DN11293_c0_g1_i3.p3  ORF type:complete len:104 (+),score=17.40 TRINITY_DN11293_c0_g1_i3:52-363(+)